MTDFDKLEAGPELDALVAERVMGIDLDGTKPHLPYRGVGCTPYSTDIAAAWEVLEELGDVTLGHQARVCNGQWVCFVDTSGPFQGPSGAADTAPLAICRAALKAAERENP